MRWFRRKAVEPLYRPLNPATVEFYLGEPMRDERPWIDADSPTWEWPSR